MSMFVKRVILSENVIGFCLAWPFHVSCMCVPSFPPPRFKGIGHAAKWELMEGFLLPLGLCDLQSCYYLGFPLRFLSRSPPHTFPSTVKVLQTTKCPL